MGFVTFDIDSLTKNDGEILKYVEDACARSVAIIAGTRTTTWCVKEKPVRRRDGRESFKPIFLDRGVDSHLMPSIHCSNCGTLMSQVAVLCSPCKRFPVHLRAGPPLVDLAWEGSNPKQTVHQAGMEAMWQAECVHSFAVSGVSFGKQLVYIADLAAVDSDRFVTTDSEFADMEYPNLDIRRLNCHTDDHFCYSVELDKTNHESLDSASAIMCRLIEESARDWLIALDGTLCNAQGGGARESLQYEDRVRLDRIISELAKLIAKHVSLQDDESRRDRLNSSCLEKKALCEFLRCSSRAYDTVMSDISAARSLYSVCSSRHLTNSTLRNANLPSELTDFLFDACPPELLAAFPANCDVYSVTCGVVAGFLHDAIQRMDAWEPPRESSVRFPGTIGICTDAAVGRRVIKPMSWVHHDTKWVAKSWPASRRTGLDHAGIRIVRLVASVWELQAASAFPQGVVHESLLRKVGTAYSARCHAVREWAVQAIQPILLRTNLVMAEATICHATPEVEDKVDEAIACFANLSLGEVLTLASPRSPLYKKSYWQIANKAAGYLTVPQRAPSYRDYVRIVLPMCVAHLANKRQQRGVPITMRSNFIAEALFSEPHLVELAKVFLESGLNNPLIFVPLNVLHTRKGRRMMHWLSEQDRKFVRHSRVGADRVRGFEIIVSDLVSVLYPGLLKP